MKIASTNDKKGFMLFIKARDVLATKNYSVYSTHIEIMCVQLWIRTSFYLKGWESNINTGCFIPSLNMCQPWVEQTIMQLNFVKYM